MLTKQKENKMEKLAKIQKELKAPKDLRNNFGGYNYRSAESILEAVKPLLDGAILTLEDDIILVGTGDNIRFYIKATATFQDGEFIKKTTAFAREPENKKGMDESQITGTASSYARKYALNGLFCIDDNKDADTDEHATELKNREEAEKPAVDVIVAGMEKMTLDDAKKYFAKAINYYGKETPEYKIWIKAWADRKDFLESLKQDKALQEDADYLNNI